MGDNILTNEINDSETYATGVGCRVVRGPDWKWSKQDGGEGHLGTVRRFDTTGEAIVVWDSGVVANYRCGTLGFDLRVLDSSPTGVKHPGTICEGCHESPIYGIRWKCVVCFCTDLCSTCYHGDKHTLTHQFLRITAPYKTRVIVGRRLKQRRVEAIGLFPKARVVRGIDWSWDSQDCVSPQTSTGGSLLLTSSNSPSCRSNTHRSRGDTTVPIGPILLPTQGRITDRRDWYPWAPRSAALVAWDSGAYNVYRVGYAGLIDLKAVRPTKGGSYYVEHLPLLADLRSITGDDLTQRVDEVGPCALVDDDVANLCRDSSGNTLIPNWTSLDELESRRRQAASCTPEIGSCQPCEGFISSDHNAGIDSSCRRGRGQEEYDHSGLIRHPNAGHPLAQVPTQRLGTTRRSRPHRDQNVRERGMRNLGSGNFRTLSQTAWNIMTDLLRTNAGPSSTTRQAVHNHLQDDATDRINTLRVNPRIVRRDGCNAQIFISSSHRNSQHDQGGHDARHQHRRMPEDADRTRTLGLVSSRRELIHAASGTCEHVDHAESRGQDTGHATHRQPRGQRLVYGVYNPIHGMNMEQTTTELQARGHAESDQHTTDSERPGQQRTNCRSSTHTSGELHRAASEGNVKRLKCLLQHRHVDVNAIHNESTALHAACDSGHLACVAILLQSGAKRQIRDASGNEPIHAAVQGGNPGIVRLLMDHVRAVPMGVAQDAAVPSTTACSGHPTNECTSSEDIPDVNSRNALRQTPLHLAVSKQDFIITQCLLEELNALQNLQDCDGDTPLHDAIAGRNIALVELLLKHNPDLTITNNGGQNPLHYATALGEVDIVRAILQICLSCSPWLVDEPQPDGMTALHLAALHGHLEIADLLLQSGASSNSTAYRLAGLIQTPPLEQPPPSSVSDPAAAAIHPNTAYTPLHLAVHKSHADVVCLLLCHGAKAGTTGQNPGRTPMQLALTALQQETQQQQQQPLRRFDVALVPFLASVSRLLVRMADTLPVTYTASYTIRDHRSAAGRSQEHQPLISIDDDDGPDEELETGDETTLFNNERNTIRLVSPSPLCKRLKSTVKATLETGVPQLVLIAACLASSIGANIHQTDEESSDAETAIARANDGFLSDIFNEALDPILQLALQQCHMEASEGTTQLRQRLGPAGDNPLLADEQETQDDLLVDLGESDEDNLLSDFFQTNITSTEQIGPLTTVTISQNASSYLIRSQEDPITFANQLSPNNDSMAMGNRSSIARVLPPSMSDLDPELRECLVCSDQPRTTIISPCGHLITCAKCASLIKKCLLCRQRITNTQELPTCCECHQNDSVVLAKPCNHALWCKACMTLKANQLNAVTDAVNMIESPFDRLQLNSDATPAEQDPVEWHNLSTEGMYTKLRHVSNLFEDLTSAGLCLDGCPVCNQPVEALWPIIVCCAAYDTQLGNAYSSRGGQVLNQQVTEELIEPKDYARTVAMEPANNFFPTQNNEIPTTRSSTELTEMGRSSTQQPVPPNNRIQRSASRLENSVRPVTSRGRTTLSDREFRRLKHELQVMREQIRCPICLDRSRNLVFMCGHATCQWCGDQVTACPICRRTVESRIILY